MMTKLGPIKFNLVREACYQAARGRRNKKDDLLQLLRSDYRLTLDDQKILADYIEGKLGQRGRPQNLERQNTLINLAKRVSDLKSEERSRGRNIRHDDAIDLVIELAGYPEGSRSAAANTLRNYISRSTKKRKVPQ
jgi:hypothetical protein